MALKTLLDLLFPNQKSLLLKKKAEEFLYLLRDKKFVSVKEAKEFIKQTKTYYKIVKKLRSIGLISLTKTTDGQFNFSLSLEAYRFFVKKQLIEEVEEVLKPKEETQTQIKA
jgi:hypothetical protein